MWVILFTAKLLIINFTNSYIGQAFTEECNIFLKRFALTKGHFGHHVAKGQVLKHPPPPPPPPSARAWFAVIYSQFMNNTLVINISAFICFFPAGYEQDFCLTFNQY